MADDAGRAGAIFVNYRRADDPFFARTLFDRLSAAFDRPIFFDVDSIPAGQSFRQVIEEALEQSDVLLAVVGPRWSDVRDEHGERRLDSPEDWVRVELETARRLGRRVIPVLAGGARVPRAGELPEGLRWLAECHALRVTTERFESDVEGLVEQVRRALAEEEERRSAREAARRRAAAAEQQRREAERRLAPDALRRAEALADWDYIKQSEDPEVFREHIGRFAGADMVRLAQKRLHDLEWRTLRRSGDVARLRAFVEAHPRGRHTNQARARLERLESAQTATGRLGISAGTPFGMGGLGVGMLGLFGLVAVMSLVHAWSTSDDRPAPVSVAEAQPVVATAPAPTDPQVGESWMPREGVELVWVPGGTFRMGSEDGNTDERPVHEVTVGGLWVMKGEVSQELYRSLTGTNPSRFGGCDGCPVELVSWLDAVAFANLLSTAERLEPAYQIEGERVSWNPEASGYRLLTEAEWEHAAQGGEDHAFAGADEATAVGWIVDNAEGRTHPSCGKPENGYGLCDMTGNVWEWEWDLDDYSYYRSSSQQNPSGPVSGSRRVARGGSWRSSARYARVAYRYWYAPGYRRVDLGFRLARPAP